MLLSGMEMITLFNEKGGETTVQVIKETAKAIQVAGGCSEAWFPKSAITFLGVNEVTGFRVADLAEWFDGTLSHQFLWISPRIA
jgi:hypothetical protein